MEGNRWECPNCGNELSGGRACPDCYHDSDQDVGFRFPLWHAFGIGALVVGAIVYQTNPEIGALIIRLAGHDTILPD